MWSGSSADAAGATAIYDYSRRAEDASGRNTAAYAADWGLQD
jgi:hypothetical protein